jgi:PIN domain nuclease of toxin-antitoxin system
MWWDANSKRLPAKVLAILKDETTTSLFSMASVWEIQIKIQLGKLRLRASLADVITHQQQTNGLELMPITLPHVLALEQLPDHHRDPFDRLLIAQAIAENVPIISQDALFAQYPINVIWQ